jgi:hypothetical protein
MREKIGNRNVGELCGADAKAYLGSSVSPLIHEKSTIDDPKKGAEGRSKNPPLFLGLKQISIINY